MPHIVILNAELEIVAAMGPGKSIVDDIGVRSGVPELLVTQGLIGSPKDAGEQT